MFALDIVNTDLYTCGNLDLQMGGLLIKLISTIYLAIQIGVPILLVFFGMLDLGKAVMAQKEDEIKKGQQMFVKRLISAVLVFLVFFIVQLAVGLVSDDEDGNFANCAKCLIKAEVSDDACVENN